ncbi:MAG: hypothetical protein HRU34_18220 [Richelia sp.]|nr:hypothetical protein [Richelia sp.]CDN15546.1 hypothetical protein RintRC_0743 [Richelia intracellularis]
MRDDFTKCSTISQWFQTLIHPALMQRPFLVFYCWYEVYQFLDILYRLTIQYLFLT